MTLRLWVVVVALVAAGCAAEAKPTAEPSPTGDPHAYARALVETTASLRDTYRTWRSNCDQGFEAACAAGAFSVWTVAETLTTELHTWADQSNAHHIPPLAGGPGARLLVETTEDALKLAEVARYYSDAQCNELGPIEKAAAECITWKGDLEGAWARLDADLTSWEKYR